MAMEEGFFIQVVEGHHSPFDPVLERFPEGFPCADAGGSGDWKAVSCPIQAR